MIQQMMKIMEGLKTGFIHEIRKLTGKKSDDYACNFDAAIWNKQTGPPSF